MEPFRQKGSSIYGIVKHLFFKSVNFFYYYYSVVETGFHVDFWTFEEAAIHQGVRCFYLKKKKKEANRFLRIV